MTVIGTPYADDATRVLLLGSGELGKEVAIELKRLGCEVIAVDRYDNAPAMQVAHRSHVIPMTDPQVLNGVILALVAFSAIYLVWMAALAWDRTSDTVQVRA